MNFFLLICALSALTIECFELKLYGSGTRNYRSSLVNKCCISCVYPKMKFYTISDNKKQCSETCLNRKEFVKLQPFIPGLTQDKKSDLPCETYNYHIYDTTKKKGVCPLCAEFDVFDADFSNEKQTQ